MRLWRELEADLAVREEQHLRRRLRTLPPGVVDLASNDYLGLATHPEVIAGAVRAAQQYGAGARAARLVSGNLELHAELERRLAAFKGTEGALLFPSGYHANLGTIAALAGKGAFIACHKRNHASLIDGCRLALANGATVRYFEDLEKLNQLLIGSDSAHKLIVVDGVFSMDGDLIDLPGVLEIAEQTDAAILLDDAHGTGTLGETGRGITEHFRIHHERVVHIGTLSKALGSQGGFVAGPQVLIEFLTNAARPFVFTTALNPPAVGGALAALDVLERGPGRVADLQRNVATLGRQLRELGFQVETRPAPILPVICGEAEAAVKLSAMLLEHGFWSPAIRPPTVAQGTARLRVTVSAAWTRADLEAIVAGFAAAQTSTL